jgi:hypothetical protein
LLTNAGWAKEAARKRAEHTLLTDADWKVLSDPSKVQHVSWPEGRQAKANAKQQVRHVGKRAEKLHSPYCKLTTVEIHDFLLDKSNNVIAP